MSGVEALFKEYYVRLTVYAYSLVSSEEVAKDIVQEVFIVLLNRKDILLRPEQVIKSFLYSTVKNQSLNHCRREAIGNKINKALEFSEADDTNHLNDLIHAEVVGTLHQELLALPDKCQHVCKLIYFDGKKYEEVAQLLNISINTVKSQRQRALRLLKSKLSFILLFFIS